MAVKIPSLEYVISGYQDVNISTVLYSCFIAWLVVLLSGNHLRKVCHWSGRDPQNNVGIAVSNVWRRKDVENKLPIGLYIFSQHLNNKWTVQNYCGKNNWIIASESEWQSDVKQLHITFSGSILQLQRKQWGLRVPWETIRCGFAFFAQSEFLRRHTICDPNCGESDYVQVQESVGLFWPAA